MPVLMISINIFVYFLPDLDMKKDIDALIAEERAEIISKYDKVTVHRETVTYRTWQYFGSWWEPWILPLNFVSENQET